MYIYMLAKADVQAEVSYYNNPGKSCKFRKVLTDMYPSV